MIKQEIDQLIELIKLKEVERVTKVNQRYESSAEHSWSCMILAEYFSKKINTKLNLNKVMRLLLYHDLVEIEVGDTFILDELKSKEQAKKEKQGVKLLKKKIPPELSNDFEQLFIEFEELKTPEAKFARAIDHLEPFIHVFRHHKNLKSMGFTEEIIREKKQKFVEPFPVLLDTFNKYIEYLKENNYI